MKYSLHPQRHPHITSRAREANARIHFLNKQGPCEISLALSEPCGWKGGGSCDTLSEETVERDTDDVIVGRMRMT